MVTTKCNKIVVLRLGLTVITTIFIMKLNEKLNEQDTRRMVKGSYCSSLFNESREKIAKPGATVTHRTAMIKRTSIGNVSNAPTIYDKNTSEINAVAARTKQGYLL
jgi:hypothetical protein